MEVEGAFRVEAAASSWGMADTLRDGAQDSQPARGSALHMYAHAPPWRTGRRRERRKPVPLAGSRNDAWRLVASSTSASARSACTR